ncbi:MAG: TldD/PmbA family protein [Myxococcales bacterium]|nr:TldD/PmbA family protein [Myxococcales bacterium]
MNRELQDIVERILDGAKKRGARGARASAYRSRESTLEWRDGKLDRLQESTQRGASVTLYVESRYSSNTTSDLRPDSLERFLDETVAMTRLLAADEHRRLPDPARYQGRFEGDLGIHDGAGLAQMTPDRRREMVERMEAAARSAPGADQIISVTSAASNSSFDSVLGATNGLLAGRSGTDFSLFTEVSVRDAGDRKPEGYEYGSSTHLSKLPDLDRTGREAVRRALELRGSRAEKSGLYPCVIENRIVGRLLGDLLAPLSGQAIQQKRSYLADKLDQPVAAEVFTVEDDPLLPGGLGSRPYDGEGLTLRRRFLFEKGVLRSFLLDTYYASKLGREPTSGGTTNLVFPTGTRDLPGLLAAMGTGILVTGFSGGNSNPATGAFSLGIRGMWVENGRPTRAVSEMNLSGNHLEFWKALLELGADTNPYSSWRTPSLRFAPVQFSGT